VLNKLGNSLKSQRRMGWVPWLLMIMKALTSMSNIVRYRTRAILVDTIEMAATFRKDKDPEIK
jgi:hypothetical protein